jgi:KDO2-lipid IV(A) lauroyltransferase
MKICEVEPAVARRAPDSALHEVEAPGAAEVAGPSSLYRATPWNACVRLARVLPQPALVTVAKVLAAVYRLACPARSEVVFNNLLPVFNGDRGAAHGAVRELFQNFAVKLADLWRYESGRSVDSLLESLTGWEHFEAARARGRGVVLVTVHLGNWEFGAPWLTRRNVKLQVITQAEPDPRLTELRQAARARWGVDTLPLGEDPFGAVEIIRRLEANHAVALLLDRPPTATAMPVRLFGRAFNASVSAAELARASGCALLPVCMPRTPGGYVVETLPEIPYDRAALRDPEARRELTQRILTAFEPVIRAHATQWYHFVPVWPASARSNGE